MAKEESNKFAAYGPAKNSRKSLERQQRENSDKSGNDHAPCDQLASEIFRVSNRGFLSVEYILSIYSERLQNIARKGRNGRPARAGHSARFSISGRYSAIEKGTYLPLS